MNIQNARFDKLLGFLQPGTSLSGEEKLLTLRSATADELVKSYVALGSPFPPWQITADGSFIRSMPGPHALSKHRHVHHLKRVLLGDCADEGSIFALQVDRMKWTSQKILELFQDGLGEENGKEIAAMYRISPEITNEQLSDCLREFISDVSWSQPIRATVRSYSGRPTYAYHISEGNPFPGPNYGRAHHCIDLLFPFLTYQAYLPTQQQDLALEWADRWLDFIHGSEPWSPYTLDSPVLMHFTSGSGGAQEVSESAIPNFDRLELVARLQDKIAEVAKHIRGTHSQ